VKPFHVATAAEAFAAGVLARCGCDVLVQYGANQPEYDLVATKGDRFLKVSVKGSQDFGWGFVQGYKKGRSYHEAIEAWARDQSPHVVYCFVQFGDVALASLPQVYLATVAEVVRHMKSTRNGHGTTILYEHHEYKSGLGSGSVDTIPASWRLSQRRVNDLMRRSA